MHQLQDFLSATRNRIYSDLDIHGLKRAVKTSLVNSYRNITVVDKDTTTFNPNPHLGDITAQRRAEGILDKVLGIFQIWKVNILQPSMISKHVRDLGTSP